MKILIVKTSSMGDLVHTLYAVSDLAYLVADLEVHWLCENAFADIPRLHPFVKKIIPFSWRQIRRRIFYPSAWRALRKLKQGLIREKYDLVIDNQGLFKSALLAKLAAAPIAGFAFASAREKLACLFYKQRYLIPETDNVIWKNRQLFALIFAYYAKIKRSDYTADLVIPHNLNLDFMPSFPFHVVVMGASRRDKLWAAEKWRELLRIRFLKDRLPVYLTWGNAAELTYCRQNSEGLNFVRITPPLGLMQAAALLRAAVSVIAVDTGLLHLANALNRPTVGIYSTSSVQNTRTEGRSWQQTVGDKGREVSVAAVADAWDKILKVVPEHYIRGK